MAFSVGLKTFVAVIDGDSLRDGDPLISKLESATPEEIIEVKKLLIIPSSKKGKEEYNPAVFSELYDMKVKEVEGFYIDKNGEKQPFNSQNQPIQKEELLRFGVASMQEFIKKIIPAHYKETCVLKIFFGIDETTGELKKNLSDILKHGSLTE